MVGIWGCMASCPFRNKRFANNDDIWHSQDFIRRYNESLYSEIPKNNTLPQNCSAEVCSSNNYYRSFSGCSNNIFSSSNYGQKDTPLNRLLESEYEDGIGEPKYLSVVDKMTPLPNPRKISTVIHSGLRWSPFVKILCCCLLKVALRNSNSVE